MTASFVLNTYPCGNRQLTHEDMSACIDIVPSRGGTETVRRKSNASLPPLDLAVTDCFRTMPSGAAALSSPPDASRKSRMRLWGQATAVLPGQTGRAGRDHWQKGRYRRRPSRLFLEDKTAAHSPEPTPPASMAIRREAKTCRGRGAAQRDPVCLPVMEPVLRLP